VGNSGVVPPRSPLTNFNIRRKGDETTSTERVARVFSQISDADTMEEEEEGEGVFLFLSSGTCWISD